MTIDGRWARDDSAAVDPALVEAMKGMEPLAPPTDVEEGAYD
jgi:hypothetical protein